MNCLHLPLLSELDRKIFGGRGYFFIECFCFCVMCLYDYDPGYLQHHYGPRDTLLLTCVPYIAGWISAALAGHYSSLFLLYLSRYIQEIF